MELIKNEKLSDYILITTYDIYDVSNLEKIFYINTIDLQNYLISLSILRKFYDLELYNDPISSFLDDSCIEIDDYIYDILSDFSVWYYSNEFDESQKGDLISWQLLDSNLNKIEYELNNDELVIVNDVIEKIIKYIDENNL